MTSHSKKLLWQIKRKAKNLRRALVRELDEDIELEQCVEWVCTTFGFRSPDDVDALYPPEGFAFDEAISGSGRYSRLRLQTESLAFDFDLDDAVARRLVEDIRPTALRHSNDSHNRSKRSDESNSTEREG